MNQQSAEFISYQDFSLLVTHNESKDQLAESLLSNKIPDTLHDLAEELSYDPGEEQLEESSTNQSEHLDTLLKSALQTSRPLSLQLAIWFVANESGFLSDSAQPFQSDKTLTEFLLDMIEPMYHRAGGNIYADMITPEIQEKRNAMDTIFVTAMKYAPITHTRIPDTVRSPFAQVNLN